EATSGGGDQGIKRKSPVEASAGGENSDNESCPNKRMKPEEQAVAIKTEPKAHSSVKVKEEPAAGEAEPAEEASSSVPPPFQIKAEPTDNGNPAPAVVVVKTVPTNSNGQAADDSSVSSSTSRPSCRFGIKCYRRNPAHRSAEAHPGEADYRRPNFPEPPLGTPPCPFGNACYRRNPTHFQMHSHPPDFNSDQNIRKRLRQRKVQRQNCPDGDATEEEEDDPFADDYDKDDDYRPGADIDEDDEDELEFDSQRVNCDDYD
ncbi:hypothetical protein KR009_007041, partial [Drosophila setifemur]